jgi:hypothetical protein
LRWGKNSADKILKLLKIIYFNAMFARILLEDAGFPFTAALAFGRDLWLSYSLLNEMPLAFEKYT